MSLTKESHCDVLVIEPHPDDASFFLNAGTLASFARAEPTHVLLVTNGESGSVATRNSLTRELTFDRPGIETMTELRRKEEERALDILGVGNLHFGNLPDGKMRREELVPCIREVIRKFNPRTIITYSEAGMTTHPDHTRSAFGVYQAVEELANDRSFHGRLSRVLTARFPPALGPALTKWADVNNPKIPTVRVPVNSQCLERKILACEAYKSQRHIGDHLRDIGALNTNSESFHVRIARNPVTGAVYSGPGMVCQQSGSVSIRPLLPPGMYTGNGTLNYEELTTRYRNFMDGNISS